MKPWNLCNLVIEKEVQHNKSIELDLNQYVTTYLLHSGNSNIEACTLLNDAWCNILNISWSEQKSRITAP